MNCESERKNIVNKNRKFALSFVGRWVQKHGAAEGDREGFFMHICIEKS